MARVMHIAGVVALAVAAAVLAAACGNGGSVDEPSPTPVPTLSPDTAIAPDSAIAFIARTAQGRPNVYVIDADSGEMRQVTQSEEFNWWPTWSPDGQRLAFISWTVEIPEDENAPMPEELTGMGLAVAALDGREQKTIADDVIVQQYSGTLSWSPDGSRIVYMAADDFTEKPIRSRIRAVDVDTESEVSLVEETLGFLPAWSPDGTRIAFGAYVGEVDETGAGENEIFVMDSDGSNVRQLSDRPGADLSPTWSPDGRRIAWWGDDPPTESRTGLPVPHIFAVEVESGRVTELGEGSDPVWSPSGHRIAFVRRKEAPSGIVQAMPEVDIFAQDVETGESIQITENAGRNLWPTWSPDGERIAFVSTRDHLAGEIYVANADGSAVRRLTDNELGEAMLTWSPSSGSTP